MKYKATLGVLCYNQLPYIEAALQSCLQQDFDSLEILISDDHSTDGTWQKVIEIVSASNTTHTVRTVRNKQRLGIAGNFNNILSLAKGELVVCQGGDDVSMLTRTKLLHEYWLENGKPMGICSDVEFIDSSGKKLTTASNVSDWWNTQKIKIQAFIDAGDFQSVDLLTSQIELLGCSSAYDRKIYDIFGPIPKSVVYEDTVSSFRASIAGKIGYLNKTLVYYRQHALAQCNRPDEVVISQETSRQREASAIKCKLQDCKLAYAKNLISRKKLNQFLAILTQQRLDSTFKPYHLSKLAMIIKRLGKYCRPRVHSTI